MGNDVLQCHIQNFPIRQGIKESLPLTLYFSLTLIANPAVLFHSLLGQSDLDRRQPTVGSGREVWKYEHSDDSHKDRQTALNEE